MWEMLFDLIMEAHPIIRYIIFSIVVISIFTVCLFTLSAVWKFTKAVNKESKIFDLSKTNHELIKENEELKKNIKMLTMSMESLNTFMYKTNTATSTILEQALNKKMNFLEEHSSKDEVAITTEEILDQKLDTQNKKEFKMSEWFLENITDYLYEIVNIFSSELSYGNRKRVSLWSILKDDEGNDTNFLESIHRSSNFSYSKDETIFLDVNKSIAGRAFRTKMSQFVTDLDNDPDWNGYSAQKKYQAIVAFPIGEHRVLTIDYKEIPSEEDLEIAQVAANYLTLLYIFRSTSVALK